MQIPILREGERKWIVLEPSLLATDEEVAQFIKEEITSMRLCQKSGLEEIIKIAQKRGILAYLKEE